MSFNQYYSGIHDMTAIKRLVKYTNQDTKLILGFRHPIAFYQSYCNFHIRRQAIHYKKHFSYKDCNKLYLPQTRFDIYLKQLSKVVITRSEEKEMKAFEHGLEVVPNPYQVFVYHLEQISDKNITRSQIFKNDFQEYLHLKTPIAEWPQNKVFHETFPEEMNICDEKFRELRKDILVNARIASSWIKDRFLDSNDVVIGDSLENFIGILNSWSSGICE